MTTDPSAHPDSTAERAPLGPGTIALLDNIYAQLDVPVYDDTLSAHARAVAGVLRALRRIPDPTDYDCASIAGVIAP